MVSKSPSQLGLEDDLDDPAIMTISRNCHSLVLGKPDLDDEFLTDNEEEYDALNDETFGQATNDGWEEAHEKLSELIKNIDVKSYFNDSLLENDDSQEDSPKTYSIWGTTPKDSGISFLQSLLQSLGHGSNSLSHQEHHAPSNASSDSGSISPQKAWKAEELKRSLLSSSNQEKPTHASTCTWPEPSQIGSSHQNLSNKSSHNQRFPNLNHNQNKLNQRVFTGEEVERHRLSDTRLGFHNKMNFPARHLPSPLAQPNMMPPIATEPHCPSNSSSDSVFINPQKAWRAEELEKNLLSSSNQEKPTHASSCTWPAPSQIGFSHQNLSNKSSHNQKFPNLNHNQNKLNQRGFTGEEVERHRLSDTRLDFHNKMNFPAHHLPSPLAQPNMMPPIATGNSNALQSSPVPHGLRGPMMGGALEHRPPYLLPFPNNLYPRSVLNQMRRSDYMLHNHPVRCNWKQYDKYHEDENYRNGHQSEDEYAGLMTQKEKELLIRIQMFSLKSENPYVEDYYYTTQLAIKFKKKYPENAKKGGGDAPELILPETPKPENKAYVPTQFEGSLGKLQAVSVNFRRKLLDIKVTRPLKDDKGRVVTNQSLMKYRQLLLHIEKLYSFFLEIEDEEKIILVKANSGEAPHRKNIAELTMKIFCGLYSEKCPEENVQNILTVKKGRNLFVRVFFLFSKEQQLQCLTCLGRCLSVILKKDQHDLILVKSYELITDAILKFSLSGLVQLGEALEKGPSIESSKEKSNFIAALKNKLGSSVICTMINRAESLYFGYNPSEADIQVRWSKIMLLLVNLLCNIDNASLSSPLTPSFELLSHFQRFAVDRDKFEILKLKLKVLETNSINGETTKKMFDKVPSEG